MRLVVAVRTRLREKMPAAQVIKNTPDFSLTVRANSDQIRHNSKKMQVLPFILIEVVRSKYSSATAVGSKKQHVSAAERKIRVNS